MNKNVLLAALVCVMALAATVGMTKTAVAEDPLGAGPVWVTPATVELNQSFSLSADSCPGANPVGADYRVEFQIDYLQPVQTQGGAAADSYSVTLTGSPIGNEIFVATWSLPSDAPTESSAYLVSAVCIGNELGADFEWFEYESAGLTVVPPAPPELTATPTTVARVYPFSVTASQCPGPQPVGADYRVEYTVTYLAPPQLPGDPDPGSFEQVYIVGGGGGLHELEISLPFDAPTLGGAYQVTAECWGNELGGDFLWHDDYEPVNLTLIIDAGPAFCNGMDVTVRVALGQQGTTGDDVIVGTPGPDVIEGRGGDDVICALGGDDIIRGGDGADTIFAGSGDDTVHAMGGNDTVWGQFGRDRLYGYDGDDRMWGGFGNDRVLGNAGNDVLSGNQGNDTVFGHEGRDILHGNQGADLLLGHEGHDRLFGYVGDDRLLGGEGDDVLHGNKGDDELIGAQGDDRLFGYAGDDSLDGGDDADTCWGNAGTNTALNCEIEG